MCALLSLVALVTALGGVMGAPTDDDRGPARDTSQLSPAFTENRGQIANGAVHYHASLAGMTVGFEPSAILVHVVPSDVSTDSARGALVRVTFPGSRPVAPIASEELPHRNHFFLGADPSRWRSDARNYRQVRYDGLFPGIDLVYRIQGGLKYEFHVGAGADPSTITIAYEGVEEVHLERGDLVARTRAGAIRDTRPTASQSGTQVACEFALRGEGVAGFVCAGWDRARPFVIDPLVYSTYLGGSAHEDGYAITVDGNGSAYVTGRSASVDFPTTPGAYDTLFGGGPMADAFIAKLSPAGTLMYSTYLGGNDYDAAVSIRVDDVGGVYLLGQTYSVDFPTTPGAYDKTGNGAGDAFVVHLDPGGRVLLYSTLLGGSGVDSPTGSSLAIDASGRAHVSGRTESTDFPVTPGAYDASANGGGDLFVARLSPSGSDLEFATYLGGSSIEAGIGVSLTLGSRGDVVLCGDTRSSDFPVTAGAFDATANGGRDVFIARLDASGAALEWATYLGGGNDESASYSRALALDAFDNAILVGVTQSPDFPVTATAFDRLLDGPSDAFAAGVSSDGRALRFATYLGGEDDDAARALALGPGGEPTFVGFTLSLNFPVTPAAYQIDPLGFGDAFIARLSASGEALLYGSYFGGTNTDEAISMTIGPGDEVYMTGQTSSADFPVTAAVHDTTANGGRDAWVARLILDVTMTWSIVVDTIPSGLRVEVDGFSYNAPYSFACPSGSVHVLYAPSPQGSGGTRYVFADWSDGGGQAHQIACDNSTATYVASFTTEHQVVVDTNPTGLIVVVNGIAWPAPHTFWCPSGDPFLLDVLSPQSIGVGVRVVFMSWSIGGSQSQTVTCSGPATIVASLSTEYSVLIDTEPPALDVVAAAARYTAPYATWCAEGTDIPVDVPSPQGTGETRHLFASWSDGGAQSRRLLCNAPLGVKANFETQHAITLETVPTGRDVLADGILAAAPHGFWCSAGGAPLIGAPSPQESGPIRYVFEGWGDGGDSTHPVFCVAPATHTATFRTEYMTTLSTDPPGLQLTLDDTTFGAPHGFWCPAASTHAIGAPSPQVADRSRHVFAAWSDGGAFTHGMSCLAPATYKATFSAEHLIEVTTDPPGRRIMLNASVILTPHAFWCRAGETRQLFVPSPQGRGLLRDVFARWTDEAPRDRVISCASPATYVARLEVDWKPLVAGFFLLALSATGSYVALRARRRSARPWRGTRAWFLVAFPFAAVELGTGIVSWFTGWLSIPPIVSVGTVVDVLVLAGGLAAQGAYAWRFQRSPPALPPAW